MDNAPEKASRGRRGYHWRTSKRRKPRYSANYETPLGGAAKALQIDSDNRLREILGNRASRHTIRNWRRGHQATPQWAIDALGRECARLRSMVDQAERWLAQTKKEAPD